MKFEICRAVPTWMTSTTRVRKMEELLKEKKGNGRLTLRGPGCAVCPLCLPRWGEDVRGDHHSKTIRRRNNPNCTFFDAQFSPEHCVICYSFSVMVSGPDPDCGMALAQVPFG